MTGGDGDAPADDGEDGGQTDGHCEIPGDRRDRGLNELIRAFLHRASRDAAPANATVPRLDKCLGVTIISESPLCAPRANMAREMFRSMGRGVARGGTVDRATRVHARWATTGASR